MSDAATVTPRVTSFAGWFLALAAIGLLPWLFSVATRQVTPTYYLIRPQVANGTLGELAQFVITITAFVIVTRIMILLAAAADDAPNISIGNALADTRGNAVMIVLAVFLCMIPLTVAGMLALTATSFMPWQAKAFAVYAVLILILFVSITLWACIASRIYQAMGDRLKQPA